MDSSNWVGRQAQRLAASMHGATQALVLPPQLKMTSNQKRIRLVWTGGIYLLSAVVWGFFLNWGSIPFGIPDWGQEWSFDSTLQQAVRQGVLPLHTSAITYGTDRFLAIPQTILSPQILLLNFVSLNAFLVFQALLLLTVGFVACLALMRYLRLSALTGSGLFLLVALNGHLIAQVAVGHVMWLGVFILPLFLLLLLKLVDGKAGARWPLAMAFTLFALLLQGSIHIYIWCLMVFGLMWLVDRKHGRELFLAALLSGLLGAFRLLPAGLAFSSANSTFYPGYPSLAHVIVGLVFPLPPSDQLWLTTSAGWWEYDMYIGLLGLALIATFGIVEPIRSKRSGRTGMYVAAGVMALLAFGYMYLPFRLLPIPLLSQERVPSRFLIISILAMLTVASQGFQQWLDRLRPGPGVRLAVLGLFFVLAQDLIQHARIWRLTLVAEAVTNKGLEVGLHIANRPDPVYTTVLAASGAISAAAIAYGLLRVLQSKIRIK